MRKSLRLIAALLAVTSLGSPALARHTWTPIGGKGDDSAEPECPAHEIMVGFQGRGGAWINQIQIVCAPLQADGTAGDSYPFRDTYGGFGGAPVKAVICKRNTRIASIHVALMPDNRMVDSLGLTCVDRTGSVASQARFGSTSGDSVGASDEYKTRKQRGLLDPIYGATHDFRCPDENFAGALLRFGQDVNAIGFICAARTPAVAAAPAPAPAPAQGGRSMVATAALLRAAQQARANQAAAAAAGRPAPPAGAAVPQSSGRAAALAGVSRPVTVKLDVDVFAAAGGEGQAVASLAAGTDGVTLIGACKSDWCHIRWADGDGWVYSGSDYNSLGR